jgi:hypothetical protein
LGHQSRFVLGRVGDGVGAGITGFSLSLPRSDTSVTLLSGCFPIVDNLGIGVLVVRIEVG